MRSAGARWPNRAQPRPPPQFRTHNDGCLVVWGEKTFCEVRGRVHTSINTLYIALRCFIFPHFVKRLHASEERYRHSGHL
jgi:hypothetical protein